MTKDLSILAVHAHPDDESSKGGATMAKYAAQGIRVVVATFTGGERGGILNPKLAHRQDILDNLTQVRRDEMAAAAAALGVEHRFLGHVDSGLPEGDPLPPLPEGCFAALPPAEAAEPLVALIREVKPQVLTTYDETGGYPHPDHIQTHVVTLAALALACDPTALPDLGSAHEVAKVYYDRGFTLERLQAIDRAMTQRGLDSPFVEWIERRRRQGAQPGGVSARINVAGFLDARDAALRAHATQVDPNGWFFAVPRAIEREIWPWEEFMRAQPAPEPGETEDDLFAGLR
ncbi:MAG: mycothiol conjugate amidase Mca [Micrococcales bacterium]|nr:mycothiol conjugate amidase Mca [Micrococcales bacterium]